jgi:ribose transport system ATP-binding protein
MVGRELSSFYDYQPRPLGDPLLEVVDLVVPGRYGHRLSFQVRAGEIVGVAGLVGAGRSEMLRVLFGVDRPVSGTIRIQGRPIALRSPSDAIAAGVALVPEDRKQQGLVLEMSVRENIGLPGLWRNRLPAAWLNRTAERQASGQMIERLRVRTASDRLAVQYLSGGNQQKVVIGKWLSLGPRVLMMDEPTRGIDVGAKHEIYRLMEELAQQGVAVLFVSSEMEEILNMSDRALVMHEGRIAGELDRVQLNEETVMRLATGRA